VSIPACGCYRRDGLTWVDLSPPPATDATGPTRAGLDLLRVGDPARQPLGVVRDRLCGERRAGGEVGEVGADRAAGGRAADRVATRAALRQEHPLLSPLLGGDRRAPRPRHVPQPRAEAIRRLGDDRHRHVRVLKAAGLRALPPVDAGVVGVQQDPVGGWPGIMSALRLSCGTQKLWMMSSVRRTVSMRVRVGCESRSPSPRRSCRGSARPRTTGCR
jgi:hypothetical protein